MCLLKGAQANASLKKQLHTFQSISAKKVRQQVKKRKNKKIKIDKTSKQPKKSFKKAQKLICF